MGGTRTSPAAVTPAVPARSKDALHTYVSLVLAAGSVVLTSSIAELSHMPHPWQWMLFGACGILTGSFTLRIAAVSASISVADTFFIATTMLFGPGPAAVVMAADTGVISWRKKHPWHRVAFNTAAPALSIWVAGRVFFALSGVKPLAEGGTPAASVIVPLFALTIVYFLLNSGLTALAIALESGRSAVKIWREHFLWLSIGYLAAASIAFCFLLLSQRVSVAAIVMVLPLLAVFHLTLRASFGRVEDAERHLGDLDRLYLSTVETLAMAIDAKDDVTHSHVRRVQAYAVGLAQALGIDAEDEIKAIKAAALLHDTGKLAVPEHILNKPGKLTGPEFDKMKQHVDIGADILSLVEFPYPVVPIVRCHHENWDGTGYPRGVKGEDIPIGARILSVVDCFDALTSDRPYRRAMTNDAALAILRERSGSMYDPHVVETFVAVYRDIPILEEDTQEQLDVMRRITESRADRKPAAEQGAAAAPQASAASSDVLAFVSLARMASGDGGVADVLALSSSLIADLLPNVTGGWYLPDAGRTTLIVADAFGPCARVVRGRSVGVGERLTGWVAASRQPIVNSDAALDLEDAAEHVSPPLRACMSVPLLAGDTLAGVLTLYAAGPETFDENRGRLLQMIGPHVAGAILAAVRNATSSTPDLDRAERAAAAPARDFRLVATR
jgi:putative nucleotidyltransferase with HDIG domain